VCDTRAAETQGSLDLTNAHWTIALQKEPVDFPSFPTKRIIKLGFGFFDQGRIHFGSKLLNVSLISPIFRTQSVRGYLVVVKPISTLVR